MIGELESALSIDRLRRFLVASGGDRSRALELYRLNLRASAEFVPGLHLWEVSLRNRLDAILTERYGLDWLIAIAGRDREFTSQHRRAVEKTVRSMQMRYGPIPLIHGDVIAEMSAGFWVGFLSRSYSRRLGFSDSPDRVFPFQPMPEIGIVHKMADEMRILRNRIAHHEPIIWLDLESRFADLRQMLGAMSPSALDLFLDGSQLSDVIERIRLAGLRRE